MKIMKLTTSVLLPVTAEVVTNKSKDNSLFYNIKHGGRGSGLFTYTIGVDKRLFKPTGTHDKLHLIDNNYIMLPIYENKKHKTDSKGNYLYFISTDTMEDHKNDYIILWEIPNKFYSNVTFKTYGDVRVIGEGLLGRSRGIENYTSPAPVLEVFGNCTLEWSATDENGKMYSHKTSLDDDGWKIGELTVVKKDVKLVSDVGTQRSYVENVLKPMASLVKTIDEFGDDSEETTY